MLEYLRRAIKASLTRLLRLIGPRTSLECVADALTSNGQFVTFHHRPILASSVATGSDDERSGERLAIVIQGPIVHCDDFTLETARIYRRHFPGAQLILSSWEDEPRDMVERFRNLGVAVVLNRKPEFAGVGNINLQITSARNGILRAVENGAEYALKTRTAMVAAR